MKSGEELFKVTKWLMISAGTWKLKLVGVPKAVQNLYKFYSVAVQVYYFSFVLSVTIRFYHFWGVDNDKVIECVSLFTMLLLLIIKVVLCQTKKMTALLAKATDNVNTTFLTGDKYITEKCSSHSRYTNILSILITIYSFSLGMNFNLASYLEYREFNQNHPNNTENEEIPYIHIYWFPFDTNKYYGVVISHQLISTLFTDIYNSQNQSLIISIIIQLSVRLQVLQYHFRNFAIDISTGKKVSKEAAYKKLKELVKKHQDLISYRKDLNDSLKYPILIEYGISSLMLAAILVQIINRKNTGFNVQYFSILAFQWFALSWNCNEITIQSEHLSYSLYESLWYEQNKATKQMLFIMILRCRIPLSFEIGPFGPMTNNAAVSRMKLAYSYVSLMS